MAIRLAPLDLTYRTLPPLKCVQPPVSPFYSSSMSAVPLNLPPLPAPTAILPASTGVPTPLFSSPPPPSSATTSSTSTCPSITMPSSPTAISISVPTRAPPMMPPPVSTAKKVSTTTTTTVSKGISKRRKRSNGELFRCPYSNCRKTTTEHSNLKAHMRLHTGETPYVCTKADCGKRFRWKSSLTYHEKALHSNLRPYGCDACLKRFVEKRKLQLHLDWCPTRHQKVAAAKAAKRNTTSTSTTEYPPNTIPLILPALQNNNINNRN